MPPRLRLPESASAAMRREAERALPHEGGGFLLGRRRGGRVSVAEATPSRNAAAADPGARFVIDPADLLRAELQARARGLEVVGIFHSHPEAPAIPSREDARTALPGLACVIAGARGGSATGIGAWWPVAGALVPMTIDATGDPLCSCREVTA